MLNNAKPYFVLNEMNTKDLPAMYSIAFWYLFVVLRMFLALLRNHCYESLLYIQQSPVTRHRRVTYVM